MTPWWLRPISPGSTEETEPARDARPEPAPAAAEPAPERRPEPEAPAPAPPASFQPPPSPAPAPPPSLAAVAPLRPSPPPEEDQPSGRESPSPLAESLSTSREGAQAEGAGAADGGAAETGDDGPGRSRSRRRRGSRGRGRALTRPEEETEAEEEESEPVAPYRRGRGHRSWEEEAPADNGNGASREVVVTVASERTQSVNDERKIALFCDLENIALGVRDSAEVKKFDIVLVLERLLEKGKIIVKKAYCDWERYSEFKRPFHEAAIELIDIPQKYYSGKNSADIKMVVDAMDLCYSKEHLDTFVILSGDSDFSPLVSKLKENNKYVIGLGVKGASSNLLISNCDEFIYYEDVWRSQQNVPKLDGLPKKSAEVFSLMIDAIEALMRENKDVLWGSMIKQTMQRKKPSFNEGYYGYSTFSELLEDAEARRIIKLKKDQRSGSYIITGFANQK